MQLVQVMTIRTRTHSNSIRNRNKLLIIFHDPVNVIQILEHVDVSRISRCIDTYYKKQLMFSLMTFFFFLVRLLVDVSKLHT